MTRKNALSLVAIVVVLIMGVIYLCVGVLGLNPTRTEHSATILLRSAGGIEVSSPVLLTGIEVGEVTGVDVGPDGVRVAITHDPDFPIALDSVMTIETLSALGEPYVSFRPQSADGPYVTDGLVIDTRDLPAPVTISETAARTVTLLEQFDPATISRLVDTMDIALDGTESVMGDLGRSTQLLAATLMARNTDFEKLLTHIQNIGGDLDWLGPTLEAGGPAWASVGDKVITPLAEEMARLTDMRDPQAYLTPNGIIGFLPRMNALLVEIGPSLAPLAPALSPLLDQAAGTVETLDLSALLGQALSMVEPDGTLKVQVRLQPGK